jgi:hypothetical protein
MDAEDSAFWEVLTQQPVGVLVSAALPWTLRIAKVDLHACIDLETIVLSHFGSLVPGQRTAQFLWQGGDGTSNRVPYGFSSVSRERRSVLDAQSFAVPHETGKMEQHREPRSTLDQRTNR